MDTALGSKASPIDVDAADDFPERRHNSADSNEHSLSPIPRSRKRKRSIPQYKKCTSQQRAIYKKNCISSRLLRLPAEIRNEIYSYVLSNNVIHISVRDCSKDDPGAWRHTDYWRDRSPASMNSFLRFTHTICPMPYDMEESAHTLANDRKYISHSHQVTTNLTTYRTRHKSCYRNLAHQKGNWLRVNDLMLQDGKMNRVNDRVTISPDYKEPSTPGLAVQFLRTCRQVYAETRDLIYTSNTFAFHEGSTLDLFLSKALSTSQRSLISGMQLDSWISDTYSPGECTRASTLRSLIGLQTLLVAVTNDSSISGQLRLRPRSASGMGIPREWEWETIVGEKTETRVGRSGIVKVTVDRVEGGKTDAVQLEQAVCRNVEARLGYIV